MEKNNFKGLAPRIKRSVFPDGSRTIHEWRKKHTSERFNNVFLMAKYNKPKFDLL